MGGGRTWDDHITEALPGRSGGVKRQLKLGCLMSYEAGSLRRLPAGVPVGWLRGGGHDAREDAGDALEAVGHQVAAQEDFRAWDR